MILSEKLVESTEAVTGVLEELRSEELWVCFIKDGVLKLKLNNDNVENDRIDIRKSKIKNGFINRG